MVLSALIRFFIFIAAIFGLWWLATGSVAQSPGSMDVTSLPTTVIVMRHAEKVNDGSRDPALSEDGRARAKSLVSALQHVEVDRLIASPFARTQNTLQPLADAHNIEVEPVGFDSGGVEGHIEQIASLVKESQPGQVIVIAGHSNTVPLIIEALSGVDVGSINETEYDRVFLIELAADASRVFEIGLAGCLESPRRNQQ